MLATNKYPTAYVKERRRAVLDHLRAFDAFAAASRPSEGIDENAFGAILGAVEAAFCANLVQTLDHAFAHRTRGLEGKDGNPLNEVRMLCAALATKEGVLVADKTIKYDPGKSVLGIKVGDKVVLARGSTCRLAEAFLDGIEAKFT